MQKLQEMQVVQQQIINQKKAQKQEKERFGEDITGVEAELKQLTNEAKKTQKQLDDEVSILVSYYA